MMAAGNVPVTLRSGEPSLAFSARRETDCRVVWSVGGSATLIFDGISRSELRFYEPKVV